jgi:HSP20 family protein
MDIKKFARWNWFNKEEEAGGVNMPVKMAEAQPVSTEETIASPLVQLHREMDQLFENAFRGFGMSPFRSDLFNPLTASGMLKPQVDIGATDKEYTITVEVPGVKQEDVKIEVADNTINIRGKKKHEAKEKDKNYYRVERSYGSFQRILSLPEDVDQEDIWAKFNDGVFTIKMSRKVLPKADAKQIEIKST